MTDEKPKPVFQPGINPISGKPIEPYPKPGETEETKHLDELYPGQMLLVKKAMDRQSEREKQAGRLPALKPGIDIKGYFGHCPVRVRGTFDGIPFFFMARHNKWILEVGPNAPSDDPGNWFVKRRFKLFTFDSYPASWMTKPDIHKLLNFSYSIWQVRSSNFLTRFFVRLKYIGK